MDELRSSERADGDRNLGACRLNFYIDNGLIIGRGEDHWEAGVESM